jgi:hypothetical protein
MGTAKGQNQKGPQGGQRQAQASLQRSIGYPNVGRRTSVHGLHDYTEITAGFRAVAIASEAPRKAQASGVVHLILGPQDLRDSLIIVL